MVKTNRNPKARREDQRQRDTVLLLISIGFLSGAVLGGLAAGKIPCDGYIQSFLQAQRQETITPGLGRELWVTFRWPLAVILFGVLPFSGLTMPLLFFLRGFFLSYGIVALAAGNGLQGMLWAVLLYGPMCLLTIPVMFVLGTVCLLRKAAPENSDSKLKPRMLLCLPPLILCVFLNQAVVPSVLTFFLKVLGE